MKITPQYVSLSDAARYMGMTRCTFRQWAQQRDIKPATYTPKGWPRFSIKELEEKK